MGGFFQSVSHLFFIIGYLLLFVISTIILKPFRVHRKRPISTILLKVTFLAFLLLFLAYTYLLLFGTKELTDNDIPFDTLFNLHFLIFLSSTIIPIIGIMMRRRIVRNRFQYNVIFIFINGVYIVYFIYAIIDHKWALL
jgi:drug/metabolite transporter (DMT)-like permease